MIIGASLEPGMNPDKENLEVLKNINGSAPDWLKGASIKTNWHGIRARPINRPAPILEHIEPGLILATGHYRNGILLCPATAEWVGQVISEEEKYL